MLPEHFKLAMYPDMWSLVELFELRVMNVFSPSIIFIEDGQSETGAMISQREEGFVIDKEVQGVPVKYIGGFRLIDI